jgi:hypothetical protein
MTIRKAIIHSLTTCISNRKRSKTAATCTRDIQGCQRRQVCSIHPSEIFSPIPSLSPSPSLPLTCAETIRDRDEPCWHPRPPSHRGSRDADQVVIHKLEGPCCIRARVEEGRRCNQAGRACHIGKVVDHTLLPLRRENDCSHSTSKHTVNGATPHTLHSPTATSKPIQSLMLLHTIPPPPPPPPPPPRYN